MAATCFSSAISTSDEKQTYWAAILPSDVIIAMLNIEIPVNSAAINLINVIVLQFVLVPIVTGMTSKLVGFKNYQDQKEKASLSLKPFDPPVIGGNLVTSKGFHRQLMIAVRISVVVAVGISNIGLGGRSRTRKIAEDGEIFVPGPIPMSETNVTGLRERLGAYVYCSIIQSDGKTYEFRSVINGECHHEVTEFVHIEKMISDQEELSVAINACNKSADESRTIRRCTTVDFVCTKSGEAGDETDGISEEKCLAVRYSEDGKYAWHCPSAVFVSQSQARLSGCRKLKVAREDVKWWIDAYTRFELTGMSAVFASAYGVSQRRKVEVEDGEEEVTIVTLFWIVPTAWIAFLLVVLACQIAWKKHLKRRAIAHTERSLFRLLEGKPIVTDDDGVVRYRR